MGKEIKFKRNNVEWAGCFTLIIAFATVLYIAYKVFIYTPTIEDRYHIEQREENKK
jgi:hypothetical protein